MLLQFFTGTQCAEIPSEWPLLRMSCLVCVYFCNCVSLPGAICFFCSINEVKFNALLEEHDFGHVTSSSCRALPLNMNKPACQLAILDLQDFTAFWQEEGEGEEKSPPPLPLEASVKCLAALWAKASPNSVMSHGEQHVHALAAALSPGPPFTSISWSKFYC